MAKREYSKYQQDAIGNYYKNKDSIMLTRLGEMVTELYLAESAAKREKLWERVEKAMIHLKIKPGLVRHIMAKKNVEILAKNLKDWDK